jgi:Glycosyl transferase family 11
MGVVVCKLPKAGLGNQLFPLMKAYTFAQLNNLPVIVTDYHQLKAGVYLRREKYKRNYSGYFIFQKNIIAEQLDKWRLGRYKKKEIVDEHELLAIEKNEVKTCYVFSQIPHWNDYFGKLKEYRPLVIDLFWKLLSKQILINVEQQAVPVIGVHIRMGDFRKLKLGEDFSKVGAVRTPEKYFVNLIEAIREINGCNLPVSVFTDGFKHEFTELFSLDNISMIEGNADIVDMLLLSKSSIIITSAGSTFSYWSAFLSNAPVLMHPDHIHQPLRPLEVAKKYYEGPFDVSKPLLIKNIKEIICENHS